MADEDRRAVGVTQASTASGGSPGRRRWFLLGSIAAVVACLAVAGTVLLVRQTSHGTPAGPPPPGSSTTGVPDGVQLRPAPVRPDVNGNINLDEAGAVYDGKMFDGPVYVNAPKVTIRNSLVRGPVSVGLDKPSASLTIVDSEITGNAIRPVCDPNTWPDAAKSAGLGVRNVTAERVDINHFGKGVVSFGNVELRDSWLHAFVVGNCDAGGQRTHADGVFLDHGSRTTIMGNFIDAADGYEGADDTRDFMTAAIFVLDGAHGSHDVARIENNHLSGGSYTVYAGGDSAHRFRWAGNRFVRSSAYPCAGVFGPVTQFDAAGGDTWGGNVWSDTGDPVPVTGVAQMSDGTCVAWTESSGPSQTQTTP